MGPQAFAKQVSVVIGRYLARLYGLQGNFEANPIVIATSLAESCWGPWFHFLHGPQPQTNYEGR